ncbi:hypothetical protein [Cytobacillus oceanisediminis]|uniref:hypothetical protein n=1 Tax=Cytobacillus oceanisediminis TaxID=665099 RepID=UPI00207921A4|nr:hypothetical protein [Cytobacillus oceanisediminis]USK44098.1 hypothetical protein LIT27_26625 [Cytobacillus oceanisediminis]
MDWSNKTWEKEDLEFSPKRKVNNKQSKYIHHNSGGFFSPKMQRVVGYESLWGECLFYYLLELDIKTIRYYEQPVNVLISTFDEKKLEVNSWTHVPDVLVFRQGYRQHLYQIKGSKDDEENKVISRACNIYANNRGWVYNKIYPKENIPDVVISNLLLLWNYLKPRKYPNILIEEILHKVTIIKNIKVVELANSFSSKIDFRFVLPAIYHLIAIGKLNVDILQPINSNSMVKHGSVLTQIADSIYMEGNHDNKNYKNW